MYAKIIQKPSSHLQIEIESAALAIGAASSIKAVRQDGSWRVSASTNAASGCLESHTSLKWFIRAAAKGCTKLQPSPDIKYQLFFVFEVRNASTGMCLLPVSIIFKHLQTIQVKDIEKQCKTCGGKSSRSRGLAKATTSELGFGALHDALAALSVPLIHPYTIDSFEVFQIWVR